MIIKNLVCCRYDYHDSVQLLMKLPSNLSVFYCSQFALYLKDPRVRAGSAFNRF